MTTSKSKPVKIQQPEYRKVIEKLKLKGKAQDRRSKCALEGGVVALITLTTL